LRWEGETVYRHDEAGHDTGFGWDAASQHYVAADGSLASLQREGDQLVWRLGEVTERFHGQSGQLQQRLGTSGHTDYHYHADGRLDRADSDHGAHARYDYDASGRLNGVVVALDGSGDTSRHFYDA
ncbi:hypothetical protein, partial [Parachitinimonas caeni]